LERGLVTVKGRDPGPGRALLYATTQLFLEYFGLAGLSDLPRLDELAAMAGVAGTTWSEAEQARFTRQGVAPEAIPSPESSEEGEGREPVEETAPSAEDAVPGDVTEAETPLPGC